MTYQFRLRDEPFEHYSEFDNAEESLTTDFAGTRQGEVSRKSSDYIRWVQESLNHILGLKLAVDGDMGMQTRSAIRSFQKQQGLKVDGIVGERTERALITETGNPPPSIRSSSATLSDLHGFTRQFIPNFIATGQRIDCADLAIELWIRFGEQHGIQANFRIWHTDEKQYRIHRRNQFRTTQSFVRYVQSNLGARGLIENTHPVPGGHRAAVAGDVFLWEYFHEVTNRRHRWGHTQILYEVIRGPSGPDTDEIEVVQGSLPPIVPEFRVKSAAYFNQPREVMLTMNAHQERHKGLVVGNGPRRFNSFKHLT